MHVYYVYGLIDPRKNEIFYIGKGKGKRFLQHLKEKEGIHSNTEKLATIKEIQKQGLEVAFEFLAQNLNEESAFILERILIYRKGRKYFNEGNLTNIVPGGRWNKKSYFLKEEQIPSIEYLQVNFPELLPVLDKHPHIAKEFRGLDCPKNPNDKKLYVFNSEGEKIHEWEIDELISIFNLFHTANLLDGLRATKEPIYAWNRIWSKTKLESVENIDIIPYQDFDIVDLDFTKQVNQFNAIKKDKKITCFFTSGILKNELIIKHSSNEILLNAYYPNGVKKHTSIYKNGKFNGESISWFNNGQINEKILYDSNDVITKESYYQSGKIKNIEKYDKNGNTLSCKEWYENGQLNSEKRKNGDYYEYSELGSIIFEGISHGDMFEGGYFLGKEYDNEGILLKEIKTYYIDRLMHGYEKSFYSTGEIRKYIDYTKGYENKITTHYKKNGEMLIK